MLVLTQNQAKAKADTLSKFLAERGVSIPSSDLLNAVARMAGLEDWNAMASQFKTRAIDTQLHDFEISHARDSLQSSIDGFGPEWQIQVASGFWLVMPKATRDDEEVDYVRVCDPLGREVVYWSVDEFTEDASCVLGALAGALNRGREDLMPHPAKPSADKITFAGLSGKPKGKKKRTGLSEIPWEDESIHVSIREADEDEDDASWHLVHYMEEEYVAALDAERLGTATEEDLALLDDAADAIALDWGDEIEGIGLDTKELRGIKAGPGASWILNDGRILKFHRYQELA